MAVEVLEIFGSGEGAFVGGQALVEWKGSQTEALGGFWHELEEAGCSGRIAGARIEGGFNFGEPDEFSGNFLGRENGFQAGDVWLGGGRPWTFRKSFDPDLAFNLGRGIWSRLRRRAGFGFGRGNFDPQFIGDVEIVQPRFEPEGVG